MPAYTLNTTGPFEGDWVLVAFDPFYGEDRTYTGTLLELLAVVYNL